MFRAGKIWLYTSIPVMLWAVIFLAPQSSQPRAQPPPQPVVQAPPVAPPSHPDFKPTNYQKRFCDDPQEIAPQGDSLIVDLKEGCFSGPILMDWIQYNEDKGQKDGDWAAVWCNGHDAPSKVRPYYEDFESADLKGCKKIYVQGRGEMHFTKLR